MTVSLLNDCLSILATQHEVEMGVANYKIKRVLNFLCAMHVILIVLTYSQNSAGALALPCYHS